LTVVSLTCSLAAISALLRPRAISFSTSRSRSVRVSSSLARRAGGPGFGAPRELLGPFVRHRWGQQRLALSNDADGLDQVLWRCRFQEECRRARGQSVEDVLVELEGRQDDDPSDARDLARRLDPVDVRHADVHQDDVGALAADELDRLAAVGRFTHDLHVRLRLDDHPKACAHERLVVGERDLDQALITS